MIKIYVVETDFSRRDIFARSKKEAIEIFRKEMKNLVTDNDKITVR